MNMEKELVIALAEAEQETTAAINSIMQKHGLPCYLFEPVVDKIHRQLIDGRASELAAARARQAENEEVTRESNK
jgi:hypothetical protein